MAIKENETKTNKLTNKQTNIQQQQQIRVALRLLILDFDDVT